MEIRKTAAMVLLGGLTIVGTLMLLWGPLRSYLPQDFGFVLRLPFAIGVLVVLVAVAAVGLAYGFGLEGRLGRSGPRPTPKRSG